MRADDNTTEMRAPRHHRCVRAVIMRQRSVARATWRAIDRVPRLRLMLIFSPLAYFLHARLITPLRHAASIFRCLSCYALRYACHFAEVPYAPFTITLAFHATMPPDDDAAISRDFTLPLRRDARSIDDMALCDGA